MASAGSCRPAAVGRARRVVRIAPGGQRPRRSGRLGSGHASVEAASAPRTTGSGRRQRLDPRGVSTSRRRCPARRLEPPPDPVVVVERHAIAAVTALGGLPSVASAIERGDPDAGIASSSATRMQRRTRPLDSRPASSVAAIRRTPGSGRRERRESAARTCGSRARREARPALEHLLAEAAPEGVAAGSRVPSADADHDDRARDGARSRPARRPGRAPRAPAPSSRTPDRIIPSWPGTPSMKARTWARRSRRDHVVERAPGGVRDAALGDLLGEADERPRSRT